MAQLVKLQERAEELEAADTEVIVVFREERDGVEGLRKSQARAKSTFRLALDLGKKTTAAYSPRKGQFANYVIGRDGIVRGLVDGDLRKRATADQLITLLKEINSENNVTDKAPTNR